MALSPMSSLKECDFSLEATNLAALLPHIHLKYMDSKMMDELSTLYGYLYSDFDPVSVAFQTAGRVRFLEQVIHSSMARTDKGSVISARWPTAGVDEMNTLCASQSTGDLHFGVVQYFIQHTVTRNLKESKTHIFAYVKWAKPHAQQNWFGQSAAVCENDYEDSSFCNYLPLQRIVSICAHAYLELKFTAYTDNVLVAIPSIALSSAQ